MQGAARLEDRRRSNFSAMPSMRLLTLILTTWRPQNLMRRSGSPANGQSRASPASPEGYGLCRPSVLFLQDCCLTSILRAATERLGGTWPAMSLHAKADSNRSVNTRVGFVLVALIAFFLFGATFRTGIHYGMDHKVSWEAWGRVSQAISAIMTAERYGEGGYALSNLIFSELNARGFTGNPEVAQKLGKNVPENLQASFLDDVLQRMWRDLPNISEHGRTEMRGLGADDIGYVDFVRVAFSMFGLHIRSFYYLFFLIYGISLLLALVERAQDRVGQGIILITASVVYASCYYADFLLLPEPQGSGNMMNPRFMPVLGLIPTVHILLVMVDGVRPQWPKVAFLLPQAGFVFFAVHIRATAVWLLAALVLAMILLSLPLIGDAVRGRAALRVVARRFLIAQWPAVMALLIVFGGLQIVSLSLHRSYKEGGWLQHHAMWHSIYYSLQYHPRFVEKYGAAHNGIVAGDEMPIAAALAYVKEHPHEDKPEIYLVPGHLTLKYSEMERFSKLAFFQFLERDPWFVVEAFAVKGAHIVDILRRETRLAWSTPTWQRIAFFSGLVTIGMLASLSSDAFRRLRQFAVVFSLGASASLAIPFLTVVYAPVMSEGVMAVQITILIWSSVLVAVVALTLRRYIVQLNLDSRPRLSPSTPANPNLGQ